MIHRKSKYSQRCNMKWFINYTKDTSNVKADLERVQKNIDSVGSMARDCIYNIRTLYSGKENQDTTIAALKTDIKKLSDELEYLRAVVIKLQWNLAWRETLSEQDPKNDAK